MEKVKTSKTREFYPCGLGDISVPSQTSVPPVWDRAVVSRRCSWAALETWDVTQMELFFSLFSPQILVALSWSWPFTSHPYSPNFNYRDFVILLFLSFLLVGCSPQPYRSNAHFSQRSNGSLLLSPSSEAQLMKFVLLQSGFHLTMSLHLSTFSILSTLLCLRSSTSLRTWSSQHSHFSSFPH